MRLLSGHTNQSEPRDYAIAKRVSDYRRYGGTLARYWILDLENREFELGTLELGTGVAAGLSFKSRDMRIWSGWSGWSEVLTGGMSGLEWQ